MPLPGVKIGKKDFIVANTAYSMEDLRLAGNDQIDEIAKAAGWKPGMEQQVLGFKIPDAMKQQVKTRGFPLLSVAPGALGAGMLATDDPENRDPVRTGLALALMGGSVAGGLAMSRSGKAVTQGLSQLDDQLKTLQQQRTALGEQMSAVRGKPGGVQQMGPINKQLAEVDAQMDSVIAQMEASKARGGQAAQQAPQAAQQAPQAAPVQAPPVPVQSIPANVAKLGKPGELERAVRRAQAVNEVYPDSRYQSEINRMYAGSVDGAENTLRRFGDDAFSAWGIPDPAVKQGGELAKRLGGGGIPEIEGSLADASRLPPPEKGFVRIWHGTNKSKVGDIKSKGLLTGKEAGGTIEDAPVVFGYTEPHFKFGDAAVAIDVPVKDVTLSSGGEARVLRSVKPSEIKGIVVQETIKPGDKVIGVNPSTGEEFTEVVKAVTEGGEYTTQGGFLLSREMHKLKKAQVAEKAARSIIPPLAVGAGLSLTKRLSPDYRQDGNYE
jgi:hypothetical protein